MIDNHTLSHSKESPVDSVHTIALPIKIKKNIYIFQL